MDPSISMSPPADHDWSSHVPATRLGRRPADDGQDVRAGEPIPDDAHAGAVAILGSGVYVGGNRPIHPGDRYLLATGNEELRILGPVHLDPGVVADRVPLDAIEGFVIEGRLMISGRPGRSDVAMAFVSVSLARGVDIIEALGAPAAAASQT